jgi:hypothetical protein
MPKNGALKSKGPWRSAAVSKVQEAETSSVLPSLAPFAGREVYLMVAFSCPAKQVNWRVWQKSRKAQELKDAYGKPQNRLRFP